MTDPKNGDGDPVLQGLNPVARITRDIRDAAATMSTLEARYLVDTYYQMQDWRIRAAAQIRSMRDDGEPHATLSWQLDQSTVLEKSIQTALDKYSNARQLGRWARSITGIGPVIAAGLLANIDFTRPESFTNVAKLWRYAGMDPTSVWEKGQKRPWNASLKRLMFLAGESFVKVQNNENDFYGKYFVQYKKDYQRRNWLGRHAERAKQVLATKNISKDTVAYGFYSGAVSPTVYRESVEQEKPWPEGRTKTTHGDEGAFGMLPPAHIHAMARRAAVKLFLSHYWHMAQKIERNMADPAKPWIIAHGGHTDMIYAPNQAVQ